tara:strand:- start:758 stop:1132 length:375 start_codon:yes stop_codon:yes gene_type:complete
MTELYDESRDDPKGYAMSDEGNSGQMGVAERMVTYSYPQNLMEAQYTGDSYQYHEVKVTATEEDAYNLECDDGHVNGEHCEVYSVDTMSDLEAIHGENRQADLDVAKYENEPVSEGQTEEDLTW